MMTPKTLKRALFLVNLPSDIRKILLSHNPTEMKDLATTADQIWEAQRTSLQHTTSVTNVPQYNALDVPTSTSTYLQAAPPPTVENCCFSETSTQKSSLSAKKGNGSTNTAATICFYHTKFGPDARRCQPGCKFAPLLSNNSPNVYSTRDVKRNTLSVHDKKKWFFLSSGYRCRCLCFIQLQRMNASRQCCQLLLWLATETSIKSWGTKKLTLNLGQKDRVST